MDSKTWMQKSIINKNKNRKKLGRKKKMEKQKGKENKTQKEAPRQSCFGCPLMNNPKGECNPTYCPNIQR